MAASANTPHVRNRRISYVAANADQSHAVDRRWEFNGLGARESAIRRRSRLVGDDRARTDGAAA
jgi:hypothetical protein